MRTRSLFLSLATLSLLGAGCTQQTEALPAVADIQVESNNNITVTPLPLDDDTVDTSTSSGPSTEDAADDTAVLAPLEIAMTSDNFSFTPSTITAKPGQRVVLTFSNEGYHAFAIDEIDVRSEIGDGVTVAFAAPTTPGSYPYYCPVGSHEELGMKGTLIVAE